MENNQVFASHIQINHKAQKPLNGESLAVGFEPDENSLSETGNLFLLYEQKKADNKINFEKLIELCGKSFYETAPDTDFEDRFKAVLKSVNKAIEGSDHNANIIIAASCGRKMLFSDIGNATLLHLRNESSTDLSSKSSSRTFHEIGQGNLQAKDKVLLASSSISQHINKKDLAIMINKQTSDDFAEHLDSNMESLGHELSYSALLIKIRSTKPAIKASEDSNISSKPSISDAKFKALMLGIQKSLKDSSAKASNKIKNLKNKRQNKTEENSVKNEKIATQISSKTKEGWTAFWSKYINPNPRQAIIVVVATILIIISILWASSAFSTKPKSLSQLENAQTLISNAQSSLSKNNQNSAQDSLNKASSILQSISKVDQDRLDEMANNKKVKSGFSATLASLVSVEDKITNTNRITSQYSFTIPQSNLKSLSWLNGSLFGLDSSSGSIIEINPLLGAPATKSSSTELKEAITMKNINDSGLVVLTKNSLIQYTNDKGLQKINTPGFPPGTNDVASYLSNLYLLSPSEGQVFRYLKSGLNLSTKASILKNISPSELSKATSFAVNGNIFVSTGNKLILFEQGAERSYQINNVPSDFGNIKDMYYNKDAGYFVLLNEASNRLALLSTESESASFIRQYAIESDSKISSFTVEPRTSQILLNSGNKIYSNKIEK